MDRPSHGNPMEVSAYWTPQHLDVTDTPLRYAAPKATWIDGFQRLRPAVRSDAIDRMARRRAQTHAVVDPAEITPLPPLTRAVAGDSRRRSGWLEDLRAMSRIVRRRGRAF
jgi:hypothetical protein